MPTHKIELDVRIIPAPDDSAEEFWVGEVRLNNRTMLWAATPAGIMLNGLHMDWPQDIFGVEDAIAYCTLRTYTINLFKD